MNPLRGSGQQTTLVSLLHAVHPKYGVLWKLGTSTGLRVSDLLRLRVRDIVPYSEVTERKTGKKRKLELTAAMHAEIMAYAAQFGLKPRDYIVFSTEYAKHKPLSRSQAWRIIARTSSKMGLSFIGAHSMRKTYAHTIYASTGELGAVQKALNHKYLETTLTYLGKKAVYVDE
jgi:integrase